MTFLEVLGVPEYRYCIVLIISGLLTAGIKVLIGFPFGDFSQGWLVGFVQAGITLASIKFIGDLR